MIPIPLGYSMSAAIALPGLGPVAILYKIGIKFANFPSLNPCGIALTMIPAGQSRCSATPRSHATLEKLPLNNENAGIRPYSFKHGDFFSEPDIERREAGFAAVFSVYLLAPHGGGEGSTLPLGEEVAVAGQSDDVGHFVGVVGEDFTGRKSEPKELEVATAMSGAERRHTAEQKERKARRVAICSA